MGRSRDTKLTRLAKAWWSPEHPDATDPRGSSQHGPKSPARHLMHQSDTWAVGGLYGRSIESDVSYLTSTLSLIALFKAFGPLCMLQSRHTGA